MEVFFIPHICKVVLECAMEVEKTLFIFIVLMGRMSIYSIY